jgi:Protein of unknown function (DUF1353)
MEEIMGEHKLGRYTGKLILEPMPGRQQMKTVEDFGFQDADGTHWPVPPGTSVDGTSIPKAVWSLLDRPWEGKYREASVLHDYHCTARSADWQTVHRMFYRAMLVSGVSERRAKLVYAGVYFAGPRWENIVRRSQPAVPSRTAPGDILYALCRDPITLAVSEAIECDGTSAFNWITSAHHQADGNAEITLGLDKISNMVEEDAPSLPSLEAAIDYAVSLIPHVEGAPRRISVGRLAVLG